jgi:DNA polymerase-3 subunit alpha
MPEWEERERLANEREVLGFYLSSHPLEEFRATLETFCTHSTTAAAALPHRSEVLLGGMLSAVTFKHSKNARPGAPTKYAMWDLEDMSGIMRCILWADDYARFTDLVEADRVLAARGVIDKRPGSEEANLIVNELIPLTALQSRYTKGAIVRIDERVHGEAALERLREIVRGYPGKCEFQVVLALADGSRVICECDGVRIAPDAEMRARIEELLGPGNFRWLAASPHLKSAANGQGNGRKRGG